MIFHLNCNFILSQILGMSSIFFEMTPAMETYSLSKDAYQASLEVNLLIKSSIKFSNHGIEVNMVGFQKLSEFVS